MASTSRRIVIKYSDISSCDSKTHVLGNSTDKDNDDDDVGVNQGVPLPTACESKVVVADPTISPHLTPSTLVVPTVDKFYNAAEKAPHTDAIVPKRKSGWWVNREMRKKKKAEERANAALELQWAFHEVA